jgi:hypothetical protein
MLVDVGSIGNGRYRLNLPIEMLIIVDARLLELHKRLQRRPKLTRKRRPARRPAHVFADRFPCAHSPFDSERTLTSGSVPTWVRGYTLAYSLWLRPVL